MVNGVASLRRNFSDCDDVDISLSDLVALHCKIMDAAGAFASAAKYPSVAGDDRVLDVLLREEIELLSWRKEKLVREIRSTIPRTPFERIMKLRFELNECGDDEIAAEAALAEFQKQGRRPMDGLDDDMTCKEFFGDDGSNDASLADICEELILAESAVRLLCRQQPEFGGLKSLISRSISRLERLDDQPCAYGVAAQ